MILLFIITAYIDPTDPLVHEYRNCRNSGIPFENLDYKFYCEICDSWVNNNSKHCVRCRRCVKDFDHHCKWINNCIGGLNYKYFFKLICSTLIFLGISSSFCLIIIIY